MAKKIRAIDGIEIKGSENIGTGIPEPSTTGNFLRTNTGSWVEGVLKSVYDTFVSATNTVLGNKVDKQQEVGNLFTETWTNLTNWTNIGTPNATVASGYVNLAGTIGFANGIRQSNFGNINSELFEIKFKYKIGTINGTTYGQIIGLDSQSTLGGSYQNHMGVQITSYTGNIGFIQWYHNKNSSPVQVSKYAISLTAGDILDCKLTSNIDGYTFEAVKPDGTKVVDRIYYNSGVGYNRVLNNASQLAIYCFGGNHQIGELSVKCQQSVNADYLIVGNSIMSQYSSGFVEDRIFNKLNQRFDANFENLSRPSNSVLDHNTKEIILFNPKKIIIDSISNTLASNANVATTMSNLATTVASFGSMITANAPTGYSVANGNLKICTPLPRGNANFQTIQSQILATYGKDNVIDLHSVAYNGTINLSLDDSFDTVHPNQYLSDRMCDKIGYDLGLKRKTKDRNPLLPFQFNNQNGFIGIGKRSLAKFLFDIVAADGTSFPQTPFRISSPSNIGGGTMTSNSDSQMYIMGGAYWNGTAFIALATTASAVVMQDGEVTYQVATGLTIGSTFSFVNAFKTDSAGRLLTGNWVGYTSGWTPPTNSGQAVFSDKKRYIRSGGANPACGVVKLVNGTLTVANTAITTNSSIILSYVQILGSCGCLETSISAGNSFTILSRTAGATTTNTADVSYVYYEIVERFA